MTEPLDSFELTIDHLSRIVDTRRDIIEKTRSFSQVPLDGCESDEAKLEAIVKATPQQRGRFRNALVWGSLVDADKKLHSPYANADIVYNGILLMGSFCEIADLSFPTQRRNLVVHSQAVTYALQRFNEGGDMRNCDDFPQQLGIGALQAAVRSYRCDGDESTAGTLASLDGLENTVFILNKDFHWSILTYRRASCELTLSGTVVEAHIDVAKRVHLMLIATGLVPRDTTLNMFRKPAFQAGNWQCGYAAIVFACHVSDDLQQIEPHVIVENDTLLTEFIRRMLAASRDNCEVAATDALRNHVYKYVD
jgi:hypothetical protein